MKINIDSKPFATEYWYSGTYIKDVGDEFEYREKYYEFTIHSTENCKTITWVDEIPENKAEIEKQILEQFNETI